MKFTIEGYENMTPEQKVAALEAYEIDMSGYVKKDVFDKKASEAAELSKQLKSKMTEDEAKKAAEAEEKANLMARLEQLEHEKAVSGYTAAYLAMGYDEKLAKSAAEALAKGDMDAVFKAQSTHATTREKALRAELLKDTPDPAGGNPDTTMTKDKFQKLSLIDKQKFAKENPETYESFYK